MSEDDKPKRRISRDQWLLAGIILALAVSGVMYRIFMWKGLQQTAALFIGLPAVLAIILALTPHPKSATGVVMKGTTVALLMSGVVLGEGFICIVMAAPLFYLVGLTIGLLIDHTRAKEKERSITLRVVVLLPIAIASFEGTLPGLSFARRETVEATKIVNASAADVERSLAQAPVFDKRLPPYLRMRFPLPAFSTGEGLQIGAERRVHFAGSEHRHPHPGDLVLRVVERDASSVTFAAESDTSHIANWLTWRTSRVSWREIAPNRTEVRWMLVYDRELDPAWYFGPWERYATTLAAEVLIDNLATPR
jgi:hypothetical protein